MIAWSGAVFLVVALVILLRVFGLVDRSREVLRVTQESLAVVRNPDLSDAKKEKALQRNSLRLFKLFLVLSAGGAAALVLPLAVVWGGDRLGWISLGAVIDVTLSPVFLIGSAVFATAALFWSGRGNASTSAYSTMDRCMHRVAFSSYRAQTILADMEDSLFAKKMGGIKVRRPVFVTGLPRAGTTMLLEALSKLPEFACHCYRDMPFVPIPCLWNQFSAHFQQSTELRERAHGDGMLIGFDSPEALEEILWKTYWRKHYGSDRIQVWGDENNPEFAAFLRSHMRKIIFLRRGGEARGVRYLSKNNLNIARVGVLRRMFRDAHIVVPFRDPVHHAASLLHQHRNFLEIHAADPFACTYMRELGHFDFGLNLRPVDFDGWFDARKSTDPGTLGFWIEYWIASYRSLLAQAETVHLVCYESLCADPKGVLASFARCIECDQVEPLLREAASIHPPRAREIDVSSVDRETIETARELYGALQALAVRAEPG